MGSTQKSQVCSWKGNKKLPCVKSPHSRRKEKRNLCTETVLVTWRRADRGEGTRKRGKVVVKIRFGQSKDTRGKSRKQAQVAGTKRSKPKVFDPDKKERRLPQLPERKLNHFI